MPTSKWRLFFQPATIPGYCLVWQVMQLSASSDKFVCCATAAEANTAPAHTATKRPNHLLEYLISDSRFRIGVGFCTEHVGWAAATTPFPVGPLSFRARCHGRRAHRTPSLAAVGPCNRLIASTTGVQNATARSGRGRVWADSLNASENGTQIFVDRQDFNDFAGMDRMNAIVRSEKRNGTPVRRPCVGRSTGEQPAQQRPVEHDWMKQRHHRQTPRPGKQLRCQPSALATIGTIADVAVQQNTCPNLPQRYLTR